MREKIMKLIGDVNEDVLSYTGDNMVGDGIVDSFEIIEIISEIEEAFDIEIDAKYVTAETLTNVEGIVALVERSKGQ